ncbi:MAG: FkbM family methyltransferase [Caldimicrobium sp.]|nr:FkbM family methyltransferase [Caldimicrobium sp.]MCX7872962.1 FkbM family methyltransferase [Caldimicrobium sp.]
MDGGGFIGDSLLVFQKYEPSKVIIFEPAPENIKLMERTIQLNRLDPSRVVIVKAGLSNKEHKAIFYVDKRNSGGSTCEFELKERGCHSYEIELTSLDTFCEKNREIFRDRAIRLIKLDIEGAELKAVEGAIKTIRENRPILLISIYHKPEDFFFIKPLLDQKVENYRYFIRKFAPNFPTLETYLIGVPGELFSK